MTALKSSSSASPPGIKHSCLLRKSRRTYELVDPKKPGEVLSFDIGQVKAIVVMDRRLREDEVVESVPAGYSEFADRFNEYATGPERFATFSYVLGKPVISKAGDPVVWDHFVIDDSLVGWHSDHTLEEPVACPSYLPSNVFQGQTPTSDSMAAGKEISQLQTLSAYMKGSMATTDELVKFWINRGAIEFDYASRMARLAQRTIGEQEPSEFRDAINAFRIEAARQAMKHNTLATQIAVELESRCLKLQLAQATHWLKVYEPSVKKLEEPLPVQEHSPYVGVSSEWKREYRIIRHSLDITRLRAMRGSRSPFHLKAGSLNDFNTSWGSPSRKMEWESLRKSCQKMEADRSQFMTELLSAFTDVLCSIRDSHDESHTTIMRAIDLFKPQEVIDEFVNNFMSEGDVGSGSDIRHYTQSSTTGAAHDSNLLAPWSLVRPLPPPPVSDTKTAPLFYIKIAENGAQSQIKSKEGEVAFVAVGPENGLSKDQFLSTDGRSIGKHTFSRSLGTQFSGHKRLSGPRPLPPPTNGSLSRSVSLSSRLSRPAQYIGQHNIQFSPSLPKNKLPLSQFPPTQGQRNLRHALPRISTGRSELEFRKDTSK